MKSEVLAALQTVGPMTTRELAAYLDVSLTSVRTSLRYLRRASTRQVRITTWNPPVLRGHWIPVYTIGTGPDTYPPRPKSRKERDARYWLNNKTRLTLKRSHRKAPAQPFDGLLKCNASTTSTF